MHILETLQQPFNVAGICRGRAFRQIGPPDGASAKLDTQCLVTQRAVVVESIVDRLLELPKLKYQLGII